MNQLLSTLDEFTTAYIEAALWSSTDDFDDATGVPLDENHGPEDIAPETLAQIVADCADFQTAHYDDISDDLSRAGHDFWLTRNRHGAGFWDGDYPQAIGAKLTEASHAYGEVNLYVGDDGQIYA